MSWINARRRRPVTGYAALLLGLVVVALLYGSLTRQGGTAQASAPPASQQDITAGEDLFEANCATCHGFGAVGNPGIAPSLIGAGAAAVYFQMSTGRMPAKEVGAENPRGPVKFSEQQIYQIADYVASLAAAPRFPPPSRYPRRERTPRSGQTCSWPTARSATALPGTAARSPTASSRRR